ncbi:MAG: 3-dehydroquinate synthase [Saonia sp.]
MKPLAPITQSFEIKYEHKLYFTENIFAVSNTLFKDIIKGYNAKDRVKIIFVIDDGVYNRHPGLLKHIKAYCSAYTDHIQFTEHVLVPGGEVCKNDHGQVERVLDAIHQNSICRHSFVAVIGGGAVIDMAGYAATIAHRGVKLIRIPTTTLSQNDAAVGVKNGINAFDKKNFLGTFAPPYAIVNDSSFLTTLEQRDWISGIAEAIKVALIKDANFFDYIDTNADSLRDREMEPMRYLIYKCAQMHMEHIAHGGDPFESGSSRPLDFGHWAAHKLEYMTDYTIRHGEAVAIGMALDLTYAHSIGLIDENTLKRIIQVLEKIGFTLRVPLVGNQAIDQLIAGIEEFREHLGGELTITLISKIGAKHDVHEIDRNKMRDAISMLNRYGKLESSH